MEPLQKTLIELSLPLLPRVRLFSREEADSIYQMSGGYVRRCERDGVCPSLVPLYVMEGLMYDHMGVEDVHGPDYRSAHEKIRLYLSLLWENVTRDPEVVGQMDFWDRVTAVTLGIPEERVGLKSKEALPSASR